MNILISTDMEGIAGINDYSQHHQSNKSVYKNSCELLTNETNIAVDACFVAGAKKVFVVDGHSKGKNIIRKQLDKRAIFVVKEKLSMMEGISKKIDFLLLIGYHGKSCQFKSFAAHSYSSKLISKIEFNGKEVGEGEINACVAKYFGVKTIFISGTDKAIEEFKAKNVRSVITKNSLRWDKAKPVNKARVHKDIKKKIQDAIKHHEDINFIDFNLKDLKIEVEFNHAFVTEKLKEKRIDNKTIYFREKDFFIGFKKLIKILRTVQDRYKEIYS